MKITRSLILTIISLLLLVAVSPAVPLTMTNALGGVSSGGNFTIGTVWSGGAVVQENTWPAAESPAKAIDGSFGVGGSKYLHLNQVNTGLMVTPDAGSAALALDGLSFYTAEAVVGRDPASYLVYGSTAILAGSTPGTLYPLAGMTLLASGSLLLPDTRSTGPVAAVSFTNNTSYASYLIVFPTVKSAVYNAGSTNSMQIAEILFHGHIVVSTAADAGAGSLRAALATAASLAGPNVIAFDPTVFTGSMPETNTITLTSAELAVNDADGVTIDASAIPGSVTISGNNARRIFNVATGASLSLRGLTITGGVDSAVRTNGSLTVDQCTFSGNGVASRGGAIGAEAGSSLVATRCTFTGNSADLGGAISFIGTNGPLTLSYCTFTGNTATFVGGAIRSFGFTGTGITLTHCTLAANHARPGGGAIDYDRNPSLDLINCLVAGTTAPNGPALDVLKLSGAPLTATGCLIGNGQSSGVANGTSGNIVGTTAAPNLARLAPLTNYGGPTQTMALLPGSPARNAGSVLSPALTSDQRGFPIVGPPDIGAYEAGTFTNYNAWIYETLPATATAAQHATSFDYDSDGQTNHDEFSYLTDPASPSSAFRPTTSRSGGNSSLSFPTATGRTYTLQQSDNLTSWTDSGQTALTGNGTVKTFTLPLTNPERRFFRVAGAP